MNLGENSSKVLRFFLASLYVITASFEIRLREII